MHIGTLETFDVSSKRWSAYIQRIKQYILVNEVREELMVPLLITAVGNDTYLMMCDLCSPTYPEDLTFDQLVNIVTKHMEPLQYGIAACKKAVDLTHSLEAVGRHAEMSGAVTAPGSISSGGGGGSGADHTSVRRGRHDGGRGPGVGGVEAAARRDLLCGVLAQFCQCVKAHELETSDVKVAARDLLYNSGTKCLRCGKAHRAGCGGEEAADRHNWDSIAHGVGTGGVEAAVQQDSSYEDAIEFMRCNVAHKIAFGSKEAAVQHDSSCVDKTNGSSMRCEREHQVEIGGVQTTGRHGCLFMDEVRGTDGEKFVEWPDLTFGEM